MSHWKNKVAVITGAGIGLGLARYTAAQINSGYSRNPISSPCFNLEWIAYPMKATRYRLRTLCQ
jgi:hypothetical protein